MVVALMGATLLATATPSGDPQPAIHAAATASGAPLVPPPSEPGAAGPEQDTPGHPQGLPGHHQDAPGYHQGLHGMPGYKIQLDDTGRPVVPGAPAHAVAAAVARTGRPPLVELEAPAGGTLLMLDDRFHHHSVAHRAADGTLSIDCGHAAASPARPHAGAGSPAACTPPTRQAATGALP
jgi:hypothetical protein